MINTKNITENKQAKRGFATQLSVSDLTDFSHGEERRNVMRKGFYTRRHYSLT